jgi:hypothetical protein
MTAQTWDSALARARNAEGHSAHVAANIAVLTELRERWQHSVDMLTSMFDLVMVPSGDRWPGSDPDTTVRLFVKMTHDQRSGQPVVNVQLFRSRGRASMTDQGGVALIAGDICTLSTAPAVVEAFLYQIARPPT